MPASRKWTPDPEVRAGRTTDFEWEGFLEDGTTPLVIAADDKVRYKLAATEGGAPVVDVLSGTPTANGSSIAITSVGKSLTPSATDTTNNTVDFSSAHGWSTGTPVYASASVGGLVHGTRYYLRALDTDTIAFFPTEADAAANTNRVDLTASITAAVIEPARGTVRLAQGDTSGLATTTPVEYFGEVILIDNSETTPADAAKLIVAGKIRFRPAQSGSLSL